MNAEMTKTRAIVSDLESFLKGTFIRGQCERIELRQKTRKGSVRILDWSVRDLDTTERTPEWLAERLLQVAESEAMASQGLVSFGVFIYNAGQQEHCARRTFSVRGTGLSEGDVMADTEDPDTAAGHLAQAYRHNEALARISIMGARDAMSFQQATIRDLTEMVTKLTDREDRVMAMREELASEEHARKLEILRETKKEERVSRMLDKGEMYLPALLMQTGIVKGNPQAESAVALDAARQLAKSLTPKQMSTLMGELTEEQMVAFGTMYKTFVKEEEEKEAKREAKEKEKEAAE